VSGAFTLAGQLRLVGAMIVLLGLSHAALPRMLAWPRQFSALPPLTRQIMHAHTFFIGLTCVLLGIVPLTFTADLLVPGRLPRVVLAGECVFWGLRWCAQFVAFPPALWRGSRLRTAGHVGFALLWTWIAAVFATALAGSLTGGQPWPRAGRTTGQR
jgi:hypothetical protein